LASVQACISGLDGRHHGFRLKVTYDRVQSITIEKPVIENIGLGFGMMFLSRVQAEIYVFYICISGLSGRHLGFILPVT